MAITGTSIQVTGLIEMQAALRKADRDLPKQLRLINKEAATEAAEGVRPLVPVRTGRLARSVGVLAQQRGAAVKAGSAVRVPYAGPINYGWSARGIKAQEFLKRGVVSRIEQISEIYEEDIRKLLSSIDTTGRI